MPRFADVVESTVETLSHDPRANIDEESVIQACQLVGIFTKKSLCTAKEIIKEIGRSVLKRVSVFLGV